MRFSDGTQIEGLNIHVVSANSISFKKFNSKNNEDNYQGNKKKTR